MKKILLATLILLIAVIAISQLATITYAAPPTSKSVKVISFYGSESDLESYLESNYSGANIIILGNPASSYWIIIIITYGSHTTIIAVDPRESGGPTLPST